MRLFGIGDNSDRSWKWYGDNDPYYGVLSNEEYRKSNLSRQALAEFFDSGIIHVDRVMNAVSRHCGTIQDGSCLDFGCGVGRLLIPFANRFTRVVGVDISEAMINEAQKNCSKAGLANVSFHGALEEVQGKFDLVHSYIVIQHIPVVRGLRIIDGLIDRMAPAGAAFLHVTVGRNAGWARDLATAIRKNVPPIHVMLNLLQRRGAFDAYMQMNKYPMNVLLAHLYDRGIRQMWCELENHQGTYGACLVFNRLPDTG